MSYTLRGRVESRLAALLPVLAGACVLAAALHAWWPLVLAALMGAVGLALDAQLYHRLFGYQPGWLALPLGLLELGLLMAVVRLAGIDAPLWPALALYGAGWTCAQLLGHAGFPLLRLGYAEDGGELGRSGLAAAAAGIAVVAAAGGFAWSQRPPTVHLAAGVHRGPLVIDRRETLVGEEGAVVRGGIVIRADDVTVRDVSVIGGENGIDVEYADNVKLERVNVAGAELDGIHVRDASVVIRDCTVHSLGSRFGQGIDISFSMGRKPSVVSGCTVIGGQEGIVTHVSEAQLVGNRVSNTTLRGISMTEMSMGMIERNEVLDARGIGIFCNDYSECMVEDNVVAGTRPDRSAGDRARIGWGVLSSYGAHAELRDNRLAANPRAAGTVAGATIEHERG